MGAPAIDLGDIDRKYYEQAIAMLQDRDTRRQLALASRPWFATYYLGLATPRHTQSWLEFFDERFGLLLGPRSHGKSIASGLVVPTHEICKSRDVRILFISRKFDGAQKSLMAVKTSLEENPRLEADFAYDRAWHPRLDVDVFGPGEGFDEEFAEAYPSVINLDAYRAKKGLRRKRNGLPWTHRKIYVDRDKLQRDPTVECVGVFGSITGGRFDLIIIDDPDDDQSVRQKKQRDRLEEWIYSTVFELLDQGGRCIIIMTRKHYDDLAGRIIANDRRFAVHHDKAVKLWPGGIPAYEKGPDGIERPVEPDPSKWRVIYRQDSIGRDVIDRIECEPGAEVLWQEKWSIEALLEKWLGGRVRFLRENQNFVTDDGTSLVKFDWLHRARNFDRGFASGEDDPTIEQLGIDLIIQAWDLALLDDELLAEEKDTDWTVGLSMGVNTDGWKRYLLRGYRRRGLGPGETRAGVRTEAALFPGVYYVAIERNAFGRLHIIELRRSREDLPIVPHDTGSGKADPDEGIPRLATVLENQKVDLPYGTPEARAFVDTLISEVHGYGLEAHDDIVLAWWIFECVLAKYQRYCEQLVKKGKVPPHIKRRQQLAGKTCAKPGPAAQAAAPKRAAPTLASRRRRARDPWA